MKLNKLETENKEPRSFWKYTKEDFRTVFRTKKKWVFLTFLVIVFFISALELILVKWDWERVNWSIFPFFLIFVFLSSFTLFLVFEELKKWRERDEEFKRIKKEAKVNNPKKYFWTIFAWILFNIFSSTSLFCFFYFLHVIQLNVYIALLIMVIFCFAFCFFSFLFDFHLRKLARKKERNLFKLTKKEKCQKN